MSLNDGYIFLLVSQITKRKKKKSYGPKRLRHLLSVTRHATYKPPVSELNPEQMTVIHGAFLNQLPL